MSQICLREIGGSKLRAKEGHVLFQVRFRRDRYKKLTTISVVECILSFASDTNIYKVGDGTFLGLSCLRMTSAEKQPRPVKTMR